MPISHTGSAISAMARNGLNDTPTNSWRRTICHEDGAMRILITGAGGFVGRHLVSHLLDVYPATIEGDRNAAVITAVDYKLPALYRDAPKRDANAGWDGMPIPGRVEVALADVSDAESIAPVVAAAKPDWIFHLAARASAMDRDREAVYNANVQGTRHVLKVATQLSSSCRVLLISTGYVYGDIAPEKPAREEDPIGPLGRFGAYTDSKIEMERVAQEYGQVALTARAFAHTGPGQRLPFAIPSFARQLARIERALDPPLLQVGNLQAGRDLMDVRDVVCAYRLLMEHGRSGIPYNIANGQPISMEAVLNRLHALSTVSVEVTVDSGRLRPADIQCSTGDSCRLRQETGWMPHYTLDRTLQDTLNYWRIEVAAEG